MADESGTEFSFFAPADVHRQILEAGLKSNDLFQLTRRAVQNGKKVSAKLEFESLKQQEPPPSPQQPKQDDVPFDIPHDGYREQMERSLRDAIEATKTVNTVQWSVDDIKSLAITIFIQRCRG